MGNFKSRMKDGPATEAAKAGSSSPASLPKSTSGVSLFPPGFAHDRELTPAEESKAYARLFQRVYSQCTDPTCWTTTCAERKAAFLKEEFHTFSMLLRHKLFATEEFCSLVLESEDATTWPRMLELLAHPGNPDTIPPAVKRDWDLAKERQAEGGCS